MEIAAMQRLIDSGNTPAAMVAVARGYLDGVVLHDLVAAEAWLMRAIETEDPLEAPKAMAMLASGVLGREEALTDRDYLDIRSRLETAEGPERQQLAQLEALASRRQKTL